MYRKRHLHFDDTWISYSLQYKLDIVSQKQNLNHKPQEDIVKLIAYENTVAKSCTAINQSLVGFSVLKGKNSESAWYRYTQAYKDSKQPNSSHADKLNTAMEISESLKLI